MVLLVRKRSRPRISQPRFVDLDLWAWTCGHGSMELDLWTTSFPMVPIALAQVQILSAVPMVILRIMVALLGIVMVLVQILSASPISLMLIRQSSSHLRWFYCLFRV